MRSGLDGLAALVLKHLEKDPLSGHLKVGGIYQTHTTPKSHFGAVVLAFAPPALGATITYCWARAALSSLPLRVFE